MLPRRRFEILLNLWVFKWDLLSYAMKLIITEDSRVTQA